MGGNGLALEVFWDRNGGLEWWVGKSWASFELGSESTVEFGGGFARLTFLCLSLAEKKAKDNEKGGALLTCWIALKKGYNNNNRRFGLNKKNQSIDE